jgi:GNAT superfamily N-acetyltransferase
MAQVPVQYPAEWVADVALRDGSTVHVRPIGPDDGDRLRAFHARLSPETIYLRYFAPHPQLSDLDVEHFTHVDHVDRVALVATMEEEIVGVGRFDRMGAADPGAAEVAFVVRDDEQGHGLGHVLLERLAAAARQRGVERFVAAVLPSNARMLRVFRDAGYATTSAYVDGYVALELVLPPVDDGGRTPGGVEDWRA